MSWKASKRRPARSVNCLTVPMPENWWSKLDLNPLKKGPNMQPSEAIQVDSLFSVKGKIALVTGGSRGIGLMIARGFVESGAKVYISSRKKEVCDEVAKELSTVGECHSIPADLSTLAGCQHLA